MKNKTALLVTFIAFSLLYSCSQKQEFKEGNVYHGFKLVEKRFIKEVNANCLYFIHEKSGARLVKIATDDENKLFDISFKTIPENDWGTPHIMEHSVLNGSKNFPVKSPFDVLMKGSLNTFLNAMTGADFTTYPVASMNVKDYFNLMHVYMDAVFNPSIYTDPKIMKQEGWHYELDSINGDITYKGVVYNEMKGAYSDPETVLNYESHKVLFPDNTYGVESGGYPQKIPQLTYDYFINFHKKFYHPSNSFVLLYGDADLNKELEFLDTSYFSHYEKSNQKVEIPLQKPFITKKSIEKHYSVPAGSETKDQTFLCYDFVAGMNTDSKLVMALDILTDALVNNQSGPLRLALQKAGIGKDVYAYLDDSKQNIVEIVVKNANVSDKEKFDKVVFNTLDEVVKKGLDKKILEGIINRMEFRLREGNTPQKGLMYLFSMKNSVLFGDDPFKGLEFEKPLAEIKQGVNNGLFESIIKEYLINNPHALLTVLQPEPGLENKVAQKTKDELAKYKASLSEEKLSDLVKETKELKDYQNQEDSPEAIATIPMLSLSDISKNVQWYQATEKSIDSIPVLHYNDFTNNIVYSYMFFDMHSLPQELIPYGNLLSELIGQLNTKNYTYGDLDNELNIETGGFHTYLNSYLENNSDDSLINKFVVYGKSTIDKADKLFELTSEIINNTKYDDIDRLKEVIIRHQSQVESNVKSYGLGYATSRLTSYYSNKGMFNELTSGLTYYDFLTDLTDHFDAKKEEIIKNLQKTAKLLFNKNNLIAGITCSDDNYVAYKNQFTNFVSSLPNENERLNEWDFNKEVKDEGLMSSSMVQYVIKGYDYKKLGYKWDGKMKVLNQILSSDYLQNKIRVLGGAYGGWASISPSGNIYFASYRDPNLSETIENYDATPEYLKSFNADSTDMTRYIIGTISSIDRPTTASQRGSKAFNNFFTKETKSELEAERNAILSTTPEDIKSYSDMVKDILAQNIICVYGNDQKIKSNKKLFKTIMQVAK